MRSTIQRVFLFVFAPLCSMTVFAAVAPAPTLPTAEVRYHFGDNPAWANPNFDDLSWTVAPNGAWPLPPLHSDGIHHSSPGPILVELNRQICSTRDSGFITCLCAAVRPDGTLILANAGHLPPYRNGEEVPIENGLPLGIAPDATYSETTIRLAPGDHLTFLSDGVVEAQSSTGELFGFDRTAAISTQSADAIAAAAQQYGQEDDITVLTLAFTPIEVLHA